MTPEDVSDANYFGSFELLSRAFRSGDLWQRDGLLVVSSGTGVILFNVAFVARRLDDPEGAIASVAGWFGARGLPFLVRVREGVDPDAEAAAEAAGIRYADTVPGMLLAPVPDVPAPPEALAIDDRPGFDEYGSVLERGFSMPDGCTRKLFTEALMSMSGTTSLLGRVDGRAVATSATVLAGGTAGVYNVATLPEARGRGVGDAMTWAAVRVAREAGHDAVVLQASTMGRPVYERMGFRVVAGYRTFARHA